MVFPPSSLSVFFVSHKFCFYHSFMLKLLPSICLHFNFVNLVFQGLSINHGFKISAIDVLLKNVLLIKKKCWKNMLNHIILFFTNAYLISFSKFETSVHSFNIFGIRYSLRILYSFLLPGT